MATVHLLKLNKWREKGELKKKEMQKRKKWRFRERVFDFSLSFQQIRLSAVFGTRRKAALRREGLAWVPDLRSLDKPLEVGVSPYLGFTLYLSVFQCFGWFKVVRGRLIGLKTWDQIVEIFLDILGQSVAVGD